MAMNFKAMDKEYIVNVYNRLNAVLDHGKGSVLYDVNGKKYIDLSAGIAVNIFGVCDDVWKKQSKHSSTNSATFPTCSTQNRKSFWRKSSVKKQE